MDYSVDVSSEYQQIKSKYFRYSLLFSSILTAVLIGDVLLITLSKEHYKLCMVVAIVITVIFSWFAIFFFTNIYKDINERYRYFKGYESGIKSTEEVEVLNLSEEQCLVNGLYVYPLFIRSYSGLTSTDKIIYSLEKNLDYKPGDKLTITTYQRILITAERHV